GAANTGHERLAAEFAFGADFARDAGDFRGEGVQLVHHRVDGVFQFENFTFDRDRDFSRQVAVRDGGRDVRDVADLAGQVRRHRVDVIGEVHLGAADAGHFRLAAELAFGADLTRHARHFRGEGVQLIHHRVDGVLQPQNFAFDVDGDLAGEVALRNGGGD